MSLDTVRISSKEYLELKQYKRLYELQRDIRLKESQSKSKFIWEPAREAARDTVFALAAIIVGVVVITGIAIFFREMFR